MLSYNDAEQEGSGLRRKIQARAQRPTKSAARGSPSRAPAGLTKVASRIGWRSTLRIGPFIWYVGTDPNEEQPDPDALDRQKRMALEEQAIALILGHEPSLQRTPINNPGFDLVEHGADGQPTRWIEVKAMTGDLHTRPVGLSRTQFDCAREHGEAYWLYVVENADSPGAARIVRIQNPAGKARTFTFDHGWLSVAQGSDSSEPGREEPSEEKDRDGEDRNL